MDDSDRRDTAIHEAGHAVMSLRLGVIVGVVTLKPWDETLAGMVSSETDYQLTPRDARLHAAVNLAGWAALAALGSPNADAGCEDDFEETRKALTTWHLGNVERWSKGAAHDATAPQRAGGKVRVGVGSRCDNFAAGEECCSGRLRANEPPRRVKHTTTGHRSRFFRAEKCAGAEEDTQGNSSLLAPSHQRRPAVFLTNWSHRRPIPVRPYAPAVANQSSNCISPISTLDRISVMAILAAASRELPPKGPKPLAPTSGSLASG
jgi:hypothetical protein